MSEKTYYIAKRNRNWCLQKDILATRRIILSSDLPTILKASTNINKSYDIVFIVTRNINCGDLSYLCDFIEKYRVINELCFNNANVGYTTFSKSIKGVIRALANNEAITSLKLARNNNLGEKIIEDLFVNNYGRHLPDG